MGSELISILIFFAYYSVT